MFKVTVTTILFKGKICELSDTMMFNNVDQDFVDFIAGSCRLVLNELIRYPVNEAEDSWVLHYQTKVDNIETGRTILNPKIISFPPMSQTQVLSFLYLAIEELKEAARLRYGDLSKDKPVYRKVPILFKLYTLWRNR